MASAAFGTVFTPHMARRSWTRPTSEGTDGWGELRIEPYGPLLLDPATSVLHYAQEVFEGLKAYAHADGSVWTFRPEANAARLDASARRMAMPCLPEGAFTEAIEALVRVDRDAVPSEADSSLYLRPFMFASEPFLGVRPSDAVEFLVIASPVGSYFSGGVKPVSIWVESEYARAGRGGTGSAKCGGNYAASMLPQVLAAERGFDQVLYLDAENLEELGGMNVFVVMDDGSIHTPTLSGSILPGITRDSLLTLARARGIDVIERRIVLSELAECLAAGRVREMFACGTAAVVTPIGRLAGEGFDVVVGDGAPGALTMSLREELTDIQYGRRPDPRGWLHRLV